MKNLSKNFSFSDMKKSIKNYFSSNRENIWVFVAIIAISFFSSLNIASGLNFSISDTTSVNDAVTFRETEEKVANVENKVSAKLATVKTTSSTTRTVRSSNSSTKATTSSCLDYDNVIGILSINGRNFNVIDGCMYKEKTLDVPTRAGYVAIYKTLFYAHNSNGGFGFLLKNNIQNITYKNKVYNLTNRQTLEKSKINMGKYVNGFPKFYLMTCAGTSYGNGDASHRLILEFSK